MFRSVSSYFLDTSAFFPCKLRIADSKEMRLC